MADSARPSNMRVQVSARFVSDEDLIADLVRVAALDDSDALTRERYNQQGNYHSATIHRRLGSWTAACEIAGLRSGRPDLGHSHEAWMRNLYEVWRRLGRQPSYGDMRGSRFSPEGYARRYSSWTDALLAFQSWVDESESEAEAQETKHALPPDRQFGRTPSLRLRFKVLQRDRFTCVGCGASPAIKPGTILHVDHIVPYSRGGATALENLQTLCDRCNLGKADP
jgi:HNH endonuclease/Homing endonuclease associated repeat